MMLGQAAVIQGNEPILADGRVLGYVTSTHRGYTVDKHIVRSAMPANWQRSTSQWCASLGKLPGVFQEREYFSGRGMPWSIAHREVAYADGDCPVAEDLCSNRELTVGGTVTWRFDQSELVDQYIEAFRKVTVMLINLDALGKAVASGEIPD